MTKRKIQYWVIPPDQSSEFVACMENVLDVYAMPYDPDFPVVCMDEQSVQLYAQTRQLAQSSFIAKEKCSVYFCAGPKFRYPLIWVAATTPEIYNTATGRCRLPIKDNQNEAMV